MSDPLKLSVIIPAYNEALRLPQTLQDASHWLTDHFSHAWEIIVVDDGSIDDTCTAARNIIGESTNIRLLEQPQNMGKGAAVRRGMLAATGEVRLFMDADHSTHIREVSKVMPILEQGHADVVIASRQHPESDISVHQSWLREHMGKTFNLLMRTMVGLDMQDTQCGFKAFSAAAADTIFPLQKLNGFSFDVELLFLTKRAGFRLSEIPVEWINEPNSRVRLLADPALMFADIIRIRNLHRND